MLTSARVSCSAGPRGRSATSPSSSSAPTCPAPAPAAAPWWPCPAAACGSSPSSRSSEPPQQLPCPKKRGWGAPSVTSPGSAAPLPPGTQQRGSRGFWWHPRDFWWHLLRVPAPRCWGGQLGVGAAQIKGDFSSPLPFLHLAGSSHKSSPGLALEVLRGASSQNCAGLGLVLGFWRCSVVPGVRLNQASHLRALINN